MYGGQAYDDIEKVRSGGTRPAERNDLCAPPQLGAEQKKERYEENESGRDGLKEEGSTVTICIRFPRIRNRNGAGTGPDREEQRGGNCRMRPVKMRDVICM